MRVGILTFHRAENFGAVLQAFALQRYIESLGHTVFVIDYYCPNIEAMYHIWNPRILVSRKNVLLSLQLYCSRFSHISERKARKKKFSAFRDENLHLCPISDMDLFDVLVTGSDQVWNLHLTGGFDNLFFLSTVGRKDARRLSYAASSDRDPDDLLFKNRKLVMNALKEYSAISVREENLKEDISRFTDKPIAVCCDPTFLIEKDNYSSIEYLPPEKDYILVYHMTESAVASTAADLLANEQKCRVIEIHGSYPKGIRNDNRHRVDLGPREILGYIRNARHIITTSFHGLSLSIILRKSFWVVDKGDNYRQKNLLNKLALTDRLITKPEECIQAPLIDYTLIEPLLKDMIEESQSFLYKSLNG